jgi:hypothetical protein
MKSSGTLYVDDSDGNVVDVSYLDGTVTILTIGSGVPTFTPDEVQALIDSLTFCRNMADKYGVTP